MWRIIRSKPDGTKRVRRARSVMNAYPDIWPERNTYPALTITDISFQRDWEIHIPQANSKKLPKSVIPVPAA